MVKKRIVRYRGYCHGCGKACQTTPIMKSAAIEPAIRVRCRDCKRITTIPKEGSQPTHA